MWNGQLLTLMIPGTYFYLVVFTPRVTMQNCDKGWSLVEMVAKLSEISLLKDQSFKASKTWNIEQFHMYDELFI